MYTALYRKYRPETFKDSLGQEHIVSVLEGALKRDQLSHAYLFAGPRGTGKTTFARIIAREAGSSANDIHEIDAASNRGIEDIRALREEVRTLPFDSKIKSYIIDEVHMLTKDAFNALLKTLEEPPAHVMFVLATTELHKVPETIVSRCQTFTFRKPSQEVLRKMITRVAKEEGVAIDKESVNLIALLGDGSFRDTHGMIQKAMSLGEKSISAENLARVMGAPRSSLVHSFVHALVDKNSAKGIQALEDARAAHIDMKLFVTLLLRVVRLALISRLAPDLFEKQAAELSDEESHFVSELSKKAEPPVLAGLLREFLSVYQEIDGAAIPELPLELALVRVVAS